MGVSINRDRGCPINYRGCLDKSISFDLAFALIPTFARLLKNKRQMRNGAMDGGIRFSRRERVKPVS